MQFSMQHGSFGKLGKVAVGVAAVAAIVGSIATHKVSAHHAFGAEFDPNRPLILRGPVTKVEWVNPHAWIHLEHTTEEGEKEIWMVERVVSTGFFLVSDAKNTNKFKEKRTNTIF